MILNIFICKFPICGKDTVQAKTIEIYSIIHVIVLRILALTKTDSAYTTTIKSNLQYCTNRAIKL